MLAEDTLKSWAYSMAVNKLCVSVYISVLEMYIDA